MKRRLTRLLVIAIGGRDGLGDFGILLGQDIVEPVGIWPEARCEVRFPYNHRGSYGGTYSLVLVGVEVSGLNGGRPAVDQKTP